MLWADVENVQAQARASSHSDKNAPGPGLLRSAAPSPRRMPGWGWSESQLSATRARVEGAWGEQMAEGQCGLKDGTPSWGWPVGRPTSGDTGVHTAAQVPG